MTKRDKKIKISAIVPVYNARSYLNKCIQSVIKQEYADWELILVDDGSTDGSSRFLDRIAEKDSRIIVYHQQNRGPGVARNKGIQLASGDFVIFIDADDYVDKEYFKLLSIKAREHDVVYIDVNQVSKKNKCLKKEYMSKYKKWSKDRILRAQMTGKIPWGGVRKAVSLKLLRENNIVFTSHSVGEEALYSFRVLYAANSVGFIDEKAVYFYVIHENSQSSQKIIDPLGSVVDEMKNFLLKQNLYETYADTVNSFNMTATIISLDRIGQFYKGADKRNKMNIRVKQFKDSYDYSYGIDYKGLSYKAKIFVPFVKNGVYWPVFVVGKFRSLLRQLTIN